MTRPVGNFFRSLKSSIIGKTLVFGGRILQLIPAEKEMIVFSGINKGQRWVRGAANATEWLGIYEASKQQVLKNLLKPGMLVFDVGANAGFYTLAMSRLTGPAGRVFAFEPLPQNGLKILKHLAINEIKNVTLVECAIADAAGQMFFQPGADDFTGKIASSGGIQVLVDTLDDYVERGGIGDPQLIKIDVEGAESRVLLGAKAILQRSRPVLMLALHGTEQRRICHELLTEAGFTLTTLKGGKIDVVEAMPDEIIAFKGGDFIKDGSIN